MNTLSSPRKTSDDTTLLDVLNHLDKFDGTGPGYRSRFQTDHLDVVADPHVIVRTAALLRQEISKATHNRLMQQSLAGKDTDAIYSIVGRAASGEGDSPAVSQAAEEIIAYCHRLCDA